jgi:hypothetical protein
MRPGTGPRRGGGTSPARSTRSRPWWCGRSVAWQVTSGKANRSHTERPRRRLAFASSAIRTCSWSQAAVTSRLNPQWRLGRAPSGCSRSFATADRCLFSASCGRYRGPCAQLISGAEPTVPLTPGRSSRRPCRRRWDHDDPMLINAARTGARLGAKFPSRAGRLAGDIDPPGCLDHARPAQSSSPVGSSSEPVNPTRKDRSRASDSCMLQCTLRAGVDGVESEPRRRALPPRTISRSAACRELPRGTASRLVREGARRRMRGCIRPRLRDVDDVEADRREGVDGLGDEPVDGTRCRSVAL